MKETAVLIGNLTGILFPARQLHACGWRVVCIGAREKRYQAKDNVLLSRAIDAFYDCPTAQSLVSRARAIREECGKRPKAYLCWDKYINLVLDEAPELFELFDMDEPGREALEKLRDKANAESLLEELGIPYPRRVSAAEALRGGEFPLVVKPRAKQLGGRIVPKMLFARDGKDLLKWPGGGDGLLRDEKEGLVLLQKLVPGGSECEYGYGGYFKGGEPVADVVFRQLRQNPPGNSCYALEEPDEAVASRVRALAVPLLKKLSYTGFLECDIKRDCETGGFYLLDVNPRQWGSVGILGAKCSGGRLFPPEACRAREGLAAWRYPLFEAGSFIRRDPNNVSYARIRQIRRGKKYRTAWALFSARDPLPFLAAYSRGAVNLAAELFRRAGAVFRR